MNKREIMKIDTNMAGLICFSWGSPKKQTYSLHFLVKPKHWVWGRDTSWYDGPIYYYGFGPLFLLCSC